jgi:hypothetical protein
MSAFHPVETSGRQRAFKQQPQNSLLRGWVKASKKPLLPYVRLMSLLCLFKVHRPMLTSIVRRTDRFTALCDHCGSIIERSDESRWARSEPLASTCSQAALADRS